VILFLIDATEPTGEVDKKLARLLVDAFKPCVMVVNKWDLAKGRADAEDYGTYLARTMPQISHAPLAFTTAMESRNVRSTIELAQSLHRQARTRVTTGQLNRAIDATLAGRQPMATKQGGQPKIYYATQVSVCPPTIVLFVNNPALVRVQYRRYTEKRIRELLPFDEVPVRLLWRARRSQQGAKVSDRDRDA
jgi:GTP-binding protein